LEELTILGAASKGQLQERAGVAQVTFVCRSVGGRPVMIHHDQEAAAAARGLGGQDNLLIDLLPETIPRNVEQLPSALLAFANSDAHRRDYVDTAKGVEEVVRALEAAGNTGARERHGGSLAG